MQGKHKLHDSAVAPAGITLFPQTRVPRAQSLFTGESQVLFILTLKVQAQGQDQGLLSWEEAPTYTCRPVQAKRADVPGFACMHVHTHTNTPMDPSWGEGNCHWGLDTDTSTCARTPVRIHTHTETLLPFFVHCSIFSLCMLHQLPFTVYLG